MIERKGILFLGKTKTKIAVVTLACIIPLGVFAYDKYEDRYDKDEHKKSSYNERMHDEHDDDDLSLSFFEKTGANLMFEGKVEKKPQKGFNGVWHISGHKVIVDDSTKIFLDDEIELKEEVEVIAKRENGTIKALFIEQD